MLSRPRHFAALLVWLCTGPVDAFPRYPSTTLRLTRVGLSSTTPVVLGTSPAFQSSRRVLRATPLEGSSLSSRPALKAACQRRRAHGKLHAAGMEGAEYDWAGLAGASPAQQLSVLTLEWSSTPSPAQLGVGAAAATDAGDDDIEVLSELLMEMGALSVVVEDADLQDTKHLWGAVGWGFGEVSRYACQKSPLEEQQRPMPWRPNESH